LRAEDEAYTGKVEVLLPNIERMSREAFQRRKMGAHDDRVKFRVSQQLSGSGLDDTQPLYSQKEVAAIVESGRNSEAQGRQIEGTKGTLTHHCGDACDCKEAQVTQRLRAEDEAYTGKVEVLLSNIERISREALSKRMLRTFQRRKMVYQRTITRRGARPPLKRRRGNRKCPYLRIRGSSSKPCPERWAHPDSCTAGLEHEG
jgi:hypothetical protein